MNKKQKRALKALLENARQASKAFGGDLEITPKTSVPIAVRDLGVRASKFAQAFHAATEVLSVLEDPSQVDETFRRLQSNQRFLELVDVPQHRLLPQNTSDAWELREALTHLLSLIDSPIFLAFLRALKDAADQYAVAGS